MRLFAKRPEAPKERRKALEVAYYRMAQRAWAAEDVARGLRAEVGELRGRLAVYEAHEDRMAELAAKHGGSDG